LAAILFKTSNIDLASKSKVWIFILIKVINQKFADVKWLTENSKGAYQRWGK